MSTDPASPDRRRLLGASLGAGLPPPCRRCCRRPRTPRASRWSSAACPSPATSRCPSPASRARPPTSRRARAEFDYEYSKYSGWPEIKESLMSGRIQAAYMLAPLVMDLADKKIPVKIVSLGHRSGAVIMVRTDSPYQHFRELAGKRIAIPSRFAVDFLFLRKMLARENMTPEDIADRRDGAARHAGRAVRQRGRRLLHRRAVRRRRAARRLCASAAHDARRVAQLHLLRAHRARGADPREPRRWCRTWSTSAGRRRLARPEAGEPRQGRARSPRAASSSTRIPKILQLRDGEPDRPRDLRRPAHDPRRVRRADAAVDRGRHDQARRSRTRTTSTSSFVRKAASRPRSRCEADDVRRIACCWLLSLAALPRRPAPTRAERSRPACSTRRGRRPSSTLHGIRRRAAQARRAIAARWCCSRSASRTARRSARSRWPRWPRRASSWARTPRDVQVVYVTVDPERDDAAQHAQVPGAASIRPSSAAPAARRQLDAVRKSYGVIAEEDRQRRRQLTTHRAIRRPST